MDTLERCHIEAVVAANSTTYQGTVNSPPFATSPQTTATYIQYQERSRQATLGTLPRGLARDDQGGSKSYC